ncbi:MAG: hypothetical protein Q8N10_04990 [Phenylobacterium sp.]|uniref:hypothetical protein n=1 Tax=Phenylobacterium sp. TaxID=1871053 RepID=UPI002720C391|nr:hypothetical protein [Phenylobacterium sp.]MDO8911679.1 hypothetical protein [Phenylobacterium sp.]MDP2011252.1 hypothetical protein [Phenylobacterium sp.]MDP3099840.1 hypothetical protein [Phenylobacterium sp.]MDP3867170.1 hypothetical protein [Phenylobacterium sp.]
MKRLLIAAAFSLLASSSASAMGGAGIILDPKCLSEAAWAVDPTAGPIRFFGCRPASEIPAPDADGFVTYTRPLVDGNDGGFTRVKLITLKQPNIVVFNVQDNGGGSGTMSVTVTGVPGPDGVMQTQGLEVQ